MSAGPSLLIGASKEPCHRDNPQKDTTRQLRVYSRKERKWREVKAVFVDDLNENWISDNLVATLDLKRLPTSEGDCEYGRREMKTFRFAGCVELQWTNQTGPPSSKYTLCRIVPCNLFEVYFCKELLLPIATTGSALSPSAQPPPVSPTTASSFIMASGSSREPIVGAFHVDGRVKQMDDDSSESIKADEWMNLLKEHVHKRLGKPQNLSRDDDIPRVKIAVLDTGIDLRHNFIYGAIDTGRIKAYRNFVIDDGPMTDSSGHGTHITALLMRVAPEAQLYVAKIAEKEEILAGHRIAEAISWAVSNEVNIITMSFGLDASHTEMQNAIKTAYSKDIIMFAAASNRGGNFPVTYPATRNEVICIYSTDGDGNPSQFNTTQRKNSRHHFAILGEGIKSAWLTSKEDGLSAGMRKSGTSFATPIAAGVAACILEFVLMHGMKEDDGDLYHKLRTLQGIQTLFYEHLVDKRSLHYIHPWKLFSKERNNQDVLHVITDLLKREV